MTLINNLSFLNILFVSITAMAYFAGFMFYHMALSNRVEKLNVYGHYIAIGAFISHTVSIILRAIAVGHFPLTRLHETLSFFAWCIVLLFLIINYSYSLRIMGLIVLPLAFISLGYALIIPKTIAPLPTILQSGLFEIHIIVAFLSYASFVIAFVTGIMYLYQEKQIKSKSKSIWHHRLPSLEILDEVNYRSISFGFPLFTLGIILGAIWAEQAFGSFWSWQEPKEVAALFTWIIYAIHLHFRIASGWRGRKTAFLSIIGFLLVLFTYLGIHYLGSGFHTFG